VPEMPPIPDVTSTPPEEFWTRKHFEGWEYVHPPEQQPYIAWLTRLGCYADLQGKSPHFIHEISRVIWDGSVDHWPAHVEERFNRIEGLNYDDAIEFINTNTEELDLMIRPQIELRKSREGDRT